MPFSKFLFDSSEDGAAEVASKKRYEEIRHFIEKEGLENFFKKSSKFGIGKDIFLSKKDLLQLALMDYQQKSEKEDANDLPAISAAPNKNNLQKHPIVKEGNGEAMSCLMEKPFESWEGTIKFKPNIIFFPQSIKGIQNLILWANQEGKRVRASGYRHSSSDIYAEDNEVLVSMLDIDTVTQLPAQYPPINPYNDLQGINLIGQEYIKDGSKKILCKIGAATCNYHFQDWVHAPTGGGSNWALPLNVIMTEITFGGSNAPICHGSGIKNKTLSDLVVEIEFINVKGERQIVNDKEQLKAASGCFGLLGIVVSLTIELDEMTYANFKTVEKKLLALTIPPPLNSPIPPQLQKELSEKNLLALNNLEMQKKAFADFVQRAEQHYYSEWFWFPLQDKCWINCWRNDGNKNKAVRYPGEFKTKKERVETYLGYLANNLFGDDLPVMRKLQTKMMGDITMANMINKEEIVCTLEDALHFRQGIQNIKTRMMEIEIPIPDIGETGIADWSICQKAWWAVIESVYSEKNMKYFPMRTTLEMRIMGGSDVLLAPQYQNKRTCSIEILTPIAVNEKRWNAFLQEILDKWSQLKDSNGNYLNIRPHWAKRFNHLNINREKAWCNEWNAEQTRVLQSYVNASSIISLPMDVYLKHIAYPQQVKDFMNQLDAICRVGGYEIKDILNRFSNPFFDNLLTPPANPNLDFNLMQLKTYHEIQKYIKKHHRSKNSMQDFVHLISTMENSQLENAIAILEKNISHFNKGFFLKTSLFQIVPMKNKLLNNLLNELISLRKPVNKLCSLT